MSSVVVAFLAMAASTAFSSNLRAVSKAERITVASVFLETIMEDLTAQPYANLLAMNGNQFFDQTVATDSNYVVDLTVFQGALDLLQIQAVLTDLSVDRELGRVTTLRTRR